MDSKGQQQRKIGHFQQVLSSGRRSGSGINGGVSSEDAKPFIENSGVLWSRHLSRKLDSRYDSEKSENTLNISIIGYTRLDSGFNLMVTQNFRYRTSGKRGCWCLETNHLMMLLPAGENSQKRTTRPPRTLRAQLVCRS